MYAGPREEMKGFASGTYYGSSKAQGRDLTDKADGDWHEICFNSLKIDRFCGLNREKNLTSIPKCVHNNRVGAPKFSLIPPTLDQLLDKLDIYCYNHPGHIRQIGGCGARSPNMKVSKFFKESKVQVFAGSEAGRTANCSYEALLNALVELKGETFAAQVKDNAPMFTGRHLTDLSKYLEHDLKQFVTYQESGFGLMHALRKDNWNEMTVDDAFKLLLGIEVGIFLVNLTGCSANHVVVINCARKTIINSSSPFHLSLCEDSLRLGCGREIVRKVEDVRQLFQKRAAKRPRNDTRRLRKKKEIVKRRRY